MAQRRLSADAKENRFSAYRRKEDNVDVIFLALVLLLLGVGLVMLYSASFAQSQYPFQGDQFRVAGTSPN